MAYKALYRTYRPRLFSGVVGQEHITTVLGNQIREGQFSHAYLFSGSRGTGKTSTAKIFARAVNCQRPKEGEPCNECPACLASAGETADIVEIDAASNNGVDNVRELIEQAQYAPLQLSHRVFIIDEVHMLSGAAFNALLKTLEEPPAHVLFILATTEPQKLPATIISRCQRFDFHRLTAAHIVANLQSVLQQAGAHIDAGGLLVLARLADGSMRDALSLADQCLSFCGSKVTEADVYDVLGSVNQDDLLRFAGELAARNAAACLAILGKAVANGRDLAVFVNDLTATVRALLIAKQCGDCAELLDCTQDTMDKLRRQAEKADEDIWLFMLEQLVETVSALRYFPSPRVLVESAILRICRPADEDSLRALAIRVAELEKKLNSPLSAALTSPLGEGGNVGANCVRPPAEPQAENPTPQAEELPPWEDAPEPEPPPPAPKTEVRPASAELPAAECDKVWESALRALQKLNAFVYAVAKEGAAKSLADGQLTVEFPLSAAKKYPQANSPLSFQKAQEAVHTAAPGVTLRFQLEKPTAAEADLLAMFGNHLTIE
ncbi:MAG: DNA polymerase III subunit gamma/tau [Clostridiales bacterium]|nr:DNA polymerase III subunit gamma/tau [Clostridiales bacterium]